MDGSFSGIFLTPWALALMGLCIGSFLNVLIHRMPLMLERSWQSDSAEMLGVPVSLAPEITLSTPRSRCPQCGHAIAWHENIPVLSYLWLGGKCSACKTAISFRYPAIELLTALLFAACGWHFGAQLQTLLWCGLVATLVALAFIDLDTQLLPDDLTLPLMWAGMVSAAAGWLPVTLEASFGGAVAGYLSLWIAHHTFRLIRGKEGMGYGDFKLLAALGAWLGWQSILSIVILSSSVGALVGIGLILFRNHGRDVPIPFGPYLAGGGIAALFFGEQVTQLWLPPV